MWHKDRVQLAPEGGGVVAAQYFGPPATEHDTFRAADEPQAFLVELGGGFLLRTHYHPVDQFQVFVTGNAKFGRDQIAAGFVHYADRLVPYGPLRPLDTGIGFLTLRGRSDVGAFFMPESQAELRDGLAAQPDVAARRRHVALAVAPSQPAGQWEFIEQHDDGLTIAQAELSAGQQLLVPEATASGAYVVVLEGRAELDGSVDSCSDEGLWWVRPFSADATIRAEADGAVVVLLGFPA